MAQELLDSSLPLVHRCRRLQETRTQVILTHPRPDHERLKQALGTFRAISSLNGGISFECDRSDVESAQGSRLFGYRSRQGRIEPHTNRLNRFDDLIPEESENVQKAIKRLPAKEAYDRVFRIRRAFQVRHSPPSPSSPDQV